MTTNVPDDRQYALAYAARFGLVPIDAADAARIAILFERAAATGSAVPRQTDKDVEPYQSAILTSRHLACS